MVQTPRDRLPTLTDDRAISPPWTEERTVCQEQPDGPVARNLLDKGERFSASQSTWADSIAEEKA